MKRSMIGAFLFKDYIVSDSIWWEIEEEKESLESRLQTSSLAKKSTLSSEDSILIQDAPGVSHCTTLSDLCGYGEVEEIKHRVDKLETQLEIITDTLKDIVTILKGN